MAPDLASEIANALASWSHEVEEEVEQIAEEVASEAVSKLRSSSPQNTGKYRKSWTKRKIKAGTYVVYAKAPHYRLTHLLEKGYVLASGGRSRPQVHIKPVEEAAVAEFEKRIRSIGK